MRSKRTAILRESAVTTDSTLRRHGSGPALTAAAHDDSVVAKNIVPGELGGEDVTNHTIVALERVRDECADYLKSLEMNTVEIHEVPAGELNEGLGEAASKVKVREIQPSNTKSNLDKNAEKTAKMHRLRSGSGPRG